MFKHKIIPIIIITSLMIISISLFVIRTVEYNSCVAEKARLSKMGPIITLKGEQSIKLNIFDQFSEPGFSATDITNGNLTAKVVASNTIKNNRIGKYTVKDKDGHIANAKRDIEIMPPATNNTSGISITFASNESSRL